MNLRKDIFQKLLYEYVINFTGEEFWFGMCSYKIHFLWLTYKIGVTGVIAINLRVDISYMGPSVVLARIHFSRIVWFIFRGGSDGCLYTFFFTIVMLVVC